jgi:hypothetical protein
MGDATEVLPDRRPWLMHTPFSYLHTMPCIMLYSLNFFKLYLVAFEGSFQWTYLLS